MIRYLLCFLACWLSTIAFCQTDSVFVNQNPQPILGKVFINYKNAQVTVKGTKDAIVFPFQEIRRIALGDGGVYAPENRKAKIQLLLLLVEGKYSLLFHEKEKLFYIRKNDSLLVIPIAHYKRALPVIFGEELTQAFYAHSNSAPDYTAKYLKRLTSYANTRSNSPETIYDRTLDQFRVRVALGLLAGVGYNRTAFSLGTQDPNGIYVYKTSDYFSATSVPFGVSIDVALTKRMSIRLDVFANNTSAQRLNISGFGTVGIAFPNYLLHPELYDPNAFLTEMSYKTYQLDIAASYTLVSPERTKIRPYIFGGPTISRLQSAEMGLSSGYRETTDSPYRYMTSYIEIDRPTHMIGFNAGLGVQYDVNKRWTVRVAGKFTGGIYTKIIRNKLSGKVNNDTTMPDRTWDFKFTSLFSAYDQYVRNAGITAGLYYKL